MDKIPFNDLKLQWAPHKEAILKSIEEIADSCSFANSSIISSTENSLSNFVKDNFYNSNKSVKSILCNSGTAALTTILRALQLPQGSKVAVQTNTFSATAFAVLNAGYKLVIVDNWDIILNDENNNLKFSCIIPVHMYGYVDSELMSKLEDWCSCNGVIMVEDACQSLGARGSCEHGLASAISFYPGKNLGAWGTAGAIVTASPRIEKFARSYIYQGYNPQTMDHEIIGNELRCDPIQATVINHGLKHLGFWNERRQEIAHKYNAAILQTPEDHQTTRYKSPINVGQLNRSSWHIFPLIKYFNNSTRECRPFTDANISIGYHYNNMLHEQSVFSKMIKSKTCDHIEARDKPHHTFSLPIYPFMTDEQINRVCSVLTQGYSYK